MDVEKEESSSRLQQHQRRGQQPNKSRKTGHMIDKEIAKMYDFLSSGYTDREMIKELRMSNRTFYWYKDKLYNHYNSIMRNKTEKVIGYHQQLLSDRLTRLYRLLELKLSTEGKNMDGSDLLAVTSMAQELAINVFKLESEGLRHVNRNINKMMLPMEEISHQYLLQQQQQQQQYQKEERGQSSQEELEELEELEEEEEEE